tara:strand:+ start:37 stop:177 length:141 start_codon:yes stop_codon:yes gene_type:complete
MLKGADYINILEQIKKLHIVLEELERHINIIKINTILKLKKYNDNI